MPMALLSRLAVQAILSAALRLALSIFKPVLNRVFSKSNVFTKSAEHLTFVNVHRARHLEVMIRLAGIRAWCSFQKNLARNKKNNIEISR